jgi:hypothetical protein
MIPAMIASLRHFLGWLVSAFRSREDLVLENLALHQQLLALHAQRPRRRLTETFIRAHLVHNWPFTSTKSRPFIHVAANDSFSVAGYSGVDAIFVNTSASVCRYESRKRSQLPVCSLSSRNCMRRCSRISCNPSSDPQIRVIDGFAGCGI